MRRRVIYPFSLEDRRLIARVRDRLRWIDTLPEPDRTWAIYGLPETEWARYSAWTEEVMRLIKQDRTTRR